MLASVYSLRLKECLFRDYRNYYKGHMDKIKGGGGRWVRDVGSAWVGWRDGEKGRQLKLNNNKN